MPRERIFGDIDLVEAVNKGESISDFARRFDVSPAAVSKRIRLLRERGILPEKEPQTIQEWKEHWLNRFQGEVLRKVIDESTELKAALAELRRLKEKVNAASRRLDEIEAELEERRDEVAGGYASEAIASIARLKTERSAVEEALVSLSVKVAEQEKLVRSLQERLRDALSLAIQGLKRDGITKARELYDQLKALRDGYEQAQAAFAGLVRRDFDFPEGLRLLSPNETGIFGKSHLDNLDRFFRDYDKRQKEVERLRIREQEEEEKLEKAIKELGFEPPVCNRHEVPVVMQYQRMKEMSNFTVRRVFKCPEPMCSNKVTILDEEATKRLQQLGPPVCRNHYNDQPVRMVFVQRSMTDKGIVKIFLCPECHREISIPDPEATARWFGQKGGETNDGSEQSNCAGR